MGHHHHNHHFEPAESLRGVYVLAIALNLLFVFAEAGLGWSCNSLGLLSDAGHNLSDVFSLLLALFALELAKVRPARNYTYGYKKGTVLISLLNAIILLVAVGAIIVESIHKFSNPAPVNGAVVSWTAGAGIIVNGVSAWLLMRKRKSDLNAEGAFLHMAESYLAASGRPVFAEALGTEVMQRRPVAPDCHVTDLAGTEKVSGQLRCAFQMLVGARFITTLLRGFGSQ